MKLDITKPIVTVDGRPAEYWGTAPDGRLILSHLQNVYGKGTQWNSAWHSPETVDAAFKNAPSLTAQQVYDRLDRYILQTFNIGAEHPYWGVRRVVQQEIFTVKPETWTPDTIYGIAGRALRSPLNDFPDF